MLSENTIRKFGTKKIDDMCFFQTWQKVVILLLYLKLLFHIIVQNFS